jgi:LacI family transcriptional regulator
MKQITVYDIAAEANVSVATVSRVLNGTAPVKNSTRIKVENLIQKYQFQPNAMARSLIKKETGIIGVILPDLTNPFFPEVFSGAEKEARITGHNFFLGNTIGEYEKESEYLNLMQEKRVDGILFLGGRINLRDCDPQLVQEVVEHSARIPIVLINGELKGTDLTRVVVDEYAGTQEAVKYLIEIGHKKIGFLGGENHMTTTSSKIRAFRKTMRDAGIPIRENWILTDSFSVDSGRLMMKRLLDQAEKPTAIVCVNDFTAIGAIKTANENGLRVPEDVSIVGFDDIPLAHHVIPELTTVSQQANLLGETAVRVLRQLMNKEKVRRVTTIEPKLIVRQSTQSI